MLQCPYTAERARLVVKEMADQLALDLVGKGLVTDQVVLTAGYDIENLKSADLKNNYHGEVKTDRYGRSIPKHAHGTAHLEQYSSSGREIVRTVMELYDRIIDSSLLIRRLNLVAANVIPEAEAVQKNKEEYVQLDLFTDYAAVRDEEERKMAELEKEKRIQQAVVEIKSRFGKNAVLKGMNLLDGATAKDRNQQIGGHKA